MDPVDGTVRGRLEAVAVALESRADEVTADVEEAIRDAIPEFANATVADLRAASIGANVGAMLRLVRGGIDATDVVAPDAALAYGRRLAAQRLPPAVIVRCYRVGQSRFLRHCLEELSRQEVAEGGGGRQVDHVTSIVLIDHVSDFIDRVLDQVLTAYEAAREPQPTNATDAADEPADATDIDAEAAALESAPHGDVNRSAPFRGP